MGRIIQDADLQLWEAYASAGDSGFPERARIIFHCLSDRTRRARFVAGDADKAGAESDVAELPEAELVALLDRSEDVR